MFPEVDPDLSNDSVLNFMISRNIRGRFARIDKSLNDVLAQHNYPESVSYLIAEAILIAVMIGQAIKLRWKLSLQIRGSGSLKLIAVDYFSPTDGERSASIRAYAKFDTNMSKKSETLAFQLLGKGFFAVLIDQGEGSDPYQGITPLTGSSLASCAETYFKQSEQLSTTFKIIVGQSTSTGNSATWMGGGIMLQQLPSMKKLETSFEEESLDTEFLKSNLAKEKVDNDHENWSRANILMNTVEELELIGPLSTPSEILHRLFHQENLIIFESQKLGFGCTCSLEKVKKALSIYSSKDIKSMTTEDGNVTVDCQFCGQHYELAPNKLGFEV